MTRALASSWFAVLLAVLVSTVEAPAAAQEDDEYQRLVADAVVEFEARRFEEARALFRQAHELSPNARTLRGIGLASFEMRDYREAYRAVRAAMDDERRALTEEQRASASELLEQTRRFLGIYALSVEPAAAELRVDGGPAALEPDGRLLLALGRHTVTATADGYHEAEVVVRVGGGEEEALALTLEEGTGSREADEGTSEAAPSGGGASEEAIVFLVAGGVIAAGALGLGLGYWLPRQLELDECGPPVGCSNAEELRDFRDLGAGLTIATGILSAAGLVIGAVLLGSAGNDAQALRCVPAGAGLACAGRF